MPEEVEGMMDDYGKNIHDFYTLDGAVALREKMKYFEKGRMVFNIAELPYKCPVAPIEFIFMADWFFDVHGVRDNIEIELVTPMAGAFSKPIASGILGEIAVQKSIKVTPNFGAQFLEGSGREDPLRFVETDHFTLKAKNADHIYVVGDATSVPASKAGAVAHYQSKTLVELPLEDQLTLAGKMRYTLTTA